MYERVGVRRPPLLTQLSDPVVKTQFYNVIPHFLSLNFFSLCQFLPRWIVTNCHWPNKACTDLPTVTHFPVFWHLISVALNHHLKSLVGHKSTKISSLSLALMVILIRQRWSLQWSLNQTWSNGHPPDLQMQTNLDVLVTDHCHWVGIVCIKLGWDFYVFCGLS